MISEDGSSKTGHLPLFTGEVPRECEGMGGA